MLVSMGNTPRGRFATLRQISVRRTRIVATMLLLTFTTALQILVPIKLWSSILGKATPVPAAWAGKATPRLPQRAANSTESKIAFLVGRASQKLVWEPSCLAQAAAAQILLRHKNSGGVVVIGLRKGVPSSPRDAKSEWSAHAWLLGKEGALSGGEAAEGFIATTVFCVPQGVQASEVSRQLGSGHGH
jgi:hypothetical protein